MKKNTNAVTFDLNKLVRQFDGCDIPEEVRASRKRQSDFFRYVNATEYPTDLSDEELARNILDILADIVPILSSYERTGMICNNIEHGMENARSVQCRRLL